MAVISYLDKLVQPSYMLCTQFKPLALARACCKVWPLNLAVLIIDNFHVAKLEHGNYFCVQWVKTREVNNHENSLLKNGNWYEHVAREISGTCVVTKLRSMLKWLNGNTRQPCISQHFQCGKKKKSLAVAGEHSYGSLVCTINNRAKPQNSLKACPGDACRGCLHKGKYLCKNLEVKEGEGHLLKRVFFH